MFNRNDTTWVEEQKLNASDGETGDEFGVSVSMESKYIIVGAPGDDDIGTDSGSAYIFNQTDATWSQDTKLTAYDGEELDAFGHSVSVDGDYAIVGAYLDDDYDLGNDSGSAYIFRGYNQAPNAPEIEGQTSGKPGTSYNYTFTSTDPDGDQISYYVDWGDNTNTGWFGPFASATPQTKSHTWSVEGKTYTIEAKTRDIYGAESIWAYLEITMPRNNRIAHNSLFLQFLERFPNMFPILRYLLGL